MEHFVAIDTKIEITCCTIDMSADVAIVSVFHLNFTSIFAISLVLRRFE